MEDNKGSTPATLCPGLIDEIFFKHPREAGEHYFEHLYYTLKVASYLIISALCAITHGLIPKFCVTTTSDRVIRLAKSMEERRAHYKEHQHKGHHHGHHHPHG